MKGTRQTKSVPAINGNRRSMSHTAGADCASQPMREKYWIELMPEERIERMRSIVKQLGEQLDAVRRVQDRTERVAHMHQHAKDGTVLVAACRNRNQCCDEEGSLGRAKGQHPNEVYF